MLTTLAPLERAALALTAGDPLPISDRDVEQLLTDPAYRSSLGVPAHATHFRRALSDGRGMHLVITIDGDASLHWDRYDPQASPAGLMMHLMTDAPEHAVTLLAVGVAVLRRLGARS